MTFNNPSQFRFDELIVEAGVVGNHNSGSQDRCHVTRNLTKLWSINDVLSGDPVYPGRADIALGVY